MARCGCGGACSCALVAGTDTVVTGAGTPANPWVVSAVVNCDAVRDCLSANQGAAFDPNTGVISVCVSPDVGNSLTRDANGCLFVSPGNNAVVTGCGLTGTGTAGNPLLVNTNAWSFACDPEDNGSDVVCGTDGRLYGEPPYHTYFFQSIENELFPAAPLVPTPDDTIVRTYSFDVTNPDPCRPMRVMSWRDVDVDFTLPPTADAAYGISTDEMMHVTNHGNATEFDTHTQTGKLTNPVASLAPGATTTLTLEVAMGKGSNGAVYNRIQASFRVTLMPA